MQIDVETMYRAFVEKDSRFEGLFYVGVKSTGIFCRPTCSAKKAKRKNVDFYSTIKEAFLSGYRPCKICKPLTELGKYPDWLSLLMEEITKNPEGKIRDGDLRHRGIDPAKIRRWFKKNHGMTFHAFQRFLRIAEAFVKIRAGEKVVDAAFESGYESLSGFGAGFKKSFGFSPEKAAGKLILTVARLPTILGPMVAIASKTGLYLLEFAERRMLETQIKRLKKRLNAEIIPGTGPLFDTLKTQLNEYFTGKRKEFEINIVLSGTDFQKQVWKCLMEIPYGQTRSYKQQAEIIDQPRAVRAVARANGDNKIAIIIPCHRIIGSDGSLTGYGGGLRRKQYLLDLEKRIVK